MIRNCISDHNSGCSATMSFDNAIWKVGLTGMPSHTNVAIMVLQIKAWLIWKGNVVPISFPGSVLMRVFDGLTQVGLCIKMLLLAVHGVADVDELTFWISLIAFVFVYLNMNSCFAHSIVVIFFKEKKTFCGIKKLCLLIFFCNFCII